MSRPPTAREIAFPILLRVDTGGAYAGILLRHMPPAVEPRERALATELVLGALRWQGRIDHALAQVCDRPIAAVDPPLRAALRLGAHQILHLDRIPAAAAVNESVRLARRAAGRGGGGFVNAVLRRLCREPLRWPGPEADPAVRLAVSLSHPEWLVRRWLTRFGEDETESLLRANNRPAPLSLRLNPRRATLGDLRDRLATAGIATDPARFAPGALRAVGGYPAGTKPFKDGWFYLQDEASQLVAAMLPAAPGGKIADLCAAPGGKAIEIASREAWVLASDRAWGRLGLVRANAARLQLRGLRFLVQDAGRPALRPASFDGVLVDAPCSGTGILRRQPEIRWRRRESDLARLAAEQAAILRAGASLVRPGGALLYSVCSLEPEEGEEVARAFLAERPEFRAEAPPPPPAGPEDELLAAGPPGPHLRTLPQRHDLDGFFAILLRRAS